MKFTPSINVFLLLIASASGFSDDAVESSSDATVSVESKRQLSDTLLQRFANLDFNIFNHNQELQVTPIVEDLSDEIEQVQSYVAEAIEPITLPNCIDDDTFEFTADMGGTRNCAWLNEGRANRRQNKYCGRGHIKGACMKTCMNCVCEDDSTFKIPLESGTGEKPCTWIVDNDGAVGQRRSKYCYESDETTSTEIGGMCTESCGFCSSLTLSPAVSMSPSVSSAPSKPPTSCKNDWDFKFRINIGGKRGCYWLTANNAAKRIKKYCGRKDVMEACKYTCDFCECDEDAEYTFVKNNGNDAKCDWLGQKWVRRQRYCYIGEDIEDYQTAYVSDIGMACPVSCKFCEKKTAMPTSSPTTSVLPSLLPSSTPSKTSLPSKLPSAIPSISPSLSSVPSLNPTLSREPSSLPSSGPSSLPSLSMAPSDLPSLTPSSMPSLSMAPSDLPSLTPSSNPSLSIEPSDVPSNIPSILPSQVPSSVPSDVPSDEPSRTPSN